MRPGRIYFLVLVDVLPPLEAGNWQTFSATKKVQALFCSDQLKLGTNENSYYRLNSILSQVACVEDEMDVSPVCGQNSRDRWDNEYCKKREKYENPFFKSDYFIEYIRHFSDDA